MSLREEIAAAEAYRDRLVVMANGAEADDNHKLAEYFDSLHEDTVQRLIDLRRELDEAESRGGLDRIARRLNLSEF